MVIFGLVINENFIQQIIKDIDIRFKKPLFMHIDDILDPDEKIFTIKQYDKQKPFNKYFVYKIGKNG